MSNSPISWRFTPIPVDLDSYGLNPYTYRVLTHITRRKKCYASLKSIAALCRMSVRQVQHALKTLEVNKMVSKQVRRGRTNIYVPTPPDLWKQPDYSIEIENASAQDYFNRAIIRRERKDSQGALADLHKSFELYEQELTEMQRQGRTSIRKEQDIRDTENEVLRLVRKPGIELDLDPGMRKWIERIENDRVNSSEDDLDDSDISTDQ